MTVWMTTCPRCKGRRGWNGDEQVSECSCPPGSSYLCPDCGTIDSAVHDTWKHDILDRIVRAETLAEVALAQATKAVPSAGREVSSREAAAMTLIRQIADLNNRPLDDAPWKMAQRFLKAYDGPETTDRHSGGPVGDWGSLPNSGCEVVQAAPLCERPNAFGGYCGECDACKAAGRSIRMAVDARCPVCGTTLPEGETGWGDCPNAAHHDVGEDDHTEPHADPISDNEVENLLRLRKEGFCGVLIEDHSICILPAFDGHRHAAEWRKAEAATPSAGVDPEAEHLLRRAKVYAPYGSSLGREIDEYLSRPSQGVAE